MSPIPAQLPVAGHSLLCPVAVSLWEAFPALANPWEASLPLANPWEASLLPANPWEASQLSANQWEASLLSANQPVESPGHTSSPVHPATEELAKCVGARVPVESPCSASCVSRIFLYAWILHHWPLLTAQLLAASYARAAFDTLKCSLPAQINFKVWFLVLCKLLDASKGFATLSPIWGLVMLPEALMPTAHAFTLLLYLLASASVSLIKGSLPLCVFLNKLALVGIATTCLSHVFYLWGFVICE